jgi:hypothetical protein
VAGGRWVRATGHLRHLAEAHADGQLAHAARHVGGGSWGFVGWLHLGEEQLAVAGGDAPALGGHGEQLAGQADDGALDDGRLDHLEWLAQERGDCTRPGLHAAHQVVELAGALGPVEAARLLGEHGGVGGLGVVLGLRLQLAGQVARNLLERELGADVRQLGRQGDGGVLRQDGQLGLGEHGARVHADVHLHERHAGDGVAVDDRPLDRGRAAVLGQQGGVDVHAAELRQIEDLLRQDLAVGHHHDQRGVEFAQEGEELGVVLDLLRLVHGEAMGEGQLFHRRRGQLLTTAGGAIGLADNGLNGPAGLNEGL